MEQIKVLFGFSDESFEEAVKALLKQKGYDAEIFARFNKDSVKQFIEKNPDKILWCGEFGTIRHCEVTSRENWMRDVITVLRENDMPYCVWNYLSTPNDGNRFSLVDDDRRQIVSERMLRVIRGEEA